MEASIEKKNDDDDGVLHFFCQKNPLKTFQDSMSVTHR